MRADDFASAARTIHGELQKYGISTAQYRDPGSPYTIKTKIDIENMSELLTELGNEKFSKAAQFKFTWILISIPEKNNILYAAIKYLCDVKYGINTILVQDANVGKVMGINNPRGQDLGLAANLALKFSMKSGGQPWALNPTDLPLIKKKTMVIGLDVTHPSPTSREGAPSIAAIAWSKDPQLSAWFVDGMTQESRREMIDGLPVLLFDAMQNHPFDIVALDSREDTKHDVVPTAASPFSTTHQPVPPTNQWYLLGSLIVFVEEDRMR